jgi:hypothetical protein
MSNDDGDRKMMQDCDVGDDITMLQKRLFMMTDHARKFWLS